MVDELLAEQTELAEQPDDDAILYIEQGGVQYHIQASNLLAGTVSDHGGLTGLTDDDHTQYLLLAGETTDAKLYSGADLIVYSDAGSTEVARIDGATGNITTDGTVDGIDIAIDVAANTVHLSSDGTDHGHIDQDVQTTASPTFVSVTASGAAGFDVTPGSDTDADLITVNVGGTPRLFWDESLDIFNWNKGHVVSYNTASSGGSTIYGLDYDVIQTGTDSLHILDFAGIVQDATVANIRGAQGFVRLHANTANAQANTLAGISAFVSVLAETGKTATIVTNAFGIAIQSPNILSDGTIAGGVFGGLHIGNQGVAGITLTYGIDIAAQSGSSYPYAIRANNGLIVFNDGFTSTANFIVRGDTIATALGVDVSADAVGVGTISPLASLHVDQTSTTGAKPVIILDQADIDLEFMKFIGSSEDGEADRSLVDAADMTTEGALVGWIQVYIEDIQATNPITDGAYYIPFYAAPSA